MILVSRHSRKQMKKTVDVNLGTFIAVARHTWDGKNVRHLEMVRETVSSQCRRIRMKRRTL